MEIDFSRIVIPSVALDLSCTVVIGTHALAYSDAVVLRFSIAPYAVYTVLQQRFLDFARNDDTRNGDSPRKSALPILRRTTISHHESLEARETLIKSDNDLISVSLALKSLTHSPLHY